MFSYTVTLALDYILGARLMLKETLAGTISELATVCFVFFVPPRYIQLVQ
jgi:hypothetical protein